MTYPRFKPGDRVICRDPGGTANHLHAGGIYTVLMITPNNLFLRVLSDSGAEKAYYPKRFDFAPPPRPTPPTIRSTWEPE